MRIALKYWRTHYDSDSDSKFDLSHFDSLDLEMVQAAISGKPEKKIPCKIMFGHHCFTRKPNPSDIYTQAQVYREPNKEGRLFCIARHELSLKYLRDWVKEQFANPKSKCFIDKYGRGHLLIRGVEFNNRQVSYELYFYISKSELNKEGVCVLIDSAFVRESRELQRVSNKQKVSIGVLVNQALREKARTLWRNAT